MEFRHKKKILKKETKGASSSFGEKRERAVSNTLPATAGLKDLAGYCRKRRQQWRKWWWSHQGWRITTGNKSRTCARSRFHHHNRSIGALSLCVNCIVILRLFFCFSEMREKETNRCKTPQVHGYSPSTGRALFITFPPLVYSFSCLIFIALSRRRWRKKTVKFEERKLRRSSTPTTTKFAEDP